MARKSNEQSLGDVIQDMLKAYRLEGKMQELDVREAWKKAMGEGVASHTKDIRLRGKTLIIYMDSGVMKQEFSYGKSRIIEIINEAMGREIIDKVEIF
ncbi:MAG: DUF721 domain-containing protein [Flavobacteriales bacterium]|nr:DUF721 domain-containing protein [Flavobacteriales bacterium]